MDGVSGYSAAAAAAAGGDGGHAGAAAPAEPDMVMVLHVFGDPLAPGKIYPVLEAERRTSGDLESRLQKEFANMPGTTRLIDAFLVRAWRLVHQERNARRRGAQLQLYKEFVGVVGNVGWMDVPYTPWNGVATTYEDLDPEADRGLLFSTLHHLPRGGSSSIGNLADLFFDVAASARHRLGQPLDPKKNCSLEEVLPVLRTRLEITRKFLEGSVSRYLNADVVQDPFAESMKECSADLLPRLKRIEGILTGGDPDLIELQRELTGLNEWKVRMQDSAPSSLLRFAGEQFGVRGLAEPAYNLFNATGVCYAMLDASVVALVSEGLLCTCLQALSTGEIDEREIRDAVEMVVRRQELSGVEHKRAIGSLSAESRGLLPEQIRVDPSQAELLEGTANGLRQRLEVAEAHPEHRDLLLALVCRDALVTGYNFCAGAQNSEEVEGVIEGVDGRAKALARRIFNTALFMEQGARGSVRLMERLLQGAAAGRRARVEAAVRAVGTKLIAGERRAPPRRVRRAVPASAAAVPEESVPVQAPEIAPQPEKVDIAALHTTTSGLEAEGHARAMREGLAHCLVQLRERLSEDKGSVRDEVNLLRQTIEFALRYSMETFDCDPQSQPGHNLAHLAGSLAEVGRVGDVVRHHSEVILSLAQGNLCANYTAEAKQLYDDARTRWLIAHVEGVFPGAREQLVQGAFRLVHDLLKVSSDPSFSLESAAPVDFQIEVVEEERLPSSPPPEAAAAASAAEPPQSVTSYPEAMQAMASMRNWIELHQTMPGSPRRGEALGHALIYLEELEARLGDLTRLRRLSDSCWGEINWAHRLVKELLVAALHQRDPDMPRCTENNPRVLAADLPDAPPMPPWIGMIHGMVSFPGSDWGGELAQMLRRADAESGLGGRLVLDFEKQCLYPLLDVAWQLVQQQFKPE